MASAMAVKAASSLNCVTRSQSAGGCSSLTISTFCSDIAWPVSRLDHARSSIERKCGAAIFAAADCCLGRKAAVSLCMGRSSAAIAGPTLPGVTELPSLEWFGPAWDAELCASRPRVKTPVGDRCEGCRGLITYSAQGVLSPEADDA